MASKCLTTADYEAILAAFRENPSNTSAVQRATGRDRETLKKYWLEGNEKRGWRPIKEVLDEEMLAARAKIAAETKTKIESAYGARPEVRVAAAQDAISSRAVEAQGIRMARATSQGVLGASAKMLAGYSKLADSVKAQLEAMAAGGKIDVMEVVEIGRKIAGTVKAGVDAAQVAMQMERLALGEPTEIVGHIAAADMTPAEAVARLEAAKQAVLDATETGLRLVHGGKDENTLVAASG